MQEAVIADKISVALTFSSHDLLLKSPIIRSREVLAINGPLMFPRKDNKAGIIRIRIIKLLKGRINKVRTTPADKDPIMEMISEGTVSLIIFPLES